MSSFAHGYLHVVDVENHDSLSAKMKANFAMHYFKTS